MSDKWRPLQQLAASLVLGLCLTWVPARPIAAQMAPDRGAAEPEARQSAPEAVNLYTDAANFQNNGAFELAAEEWERFLKRFPQDPLAAKAQHYAGVCYLQLKQLDKASAAFSAVLEKHPNFELAEDALLNLGWSQYLLATQGQAPLYDEAAKTFTELVKKHPQGKFTDQALFFLGESQYAREKKQDAVTSYGYLLRHFPESRFRCDALYAMGVAREELGQFAEAGELYDQFLAQCGDSELVTEVRMRKAETLLQANDYAAAKPLFAEVAAVEGFALADHALMRQAYAAVQQEQFAEAGQLYQQVLDRFPRSQYAHEALVSAGRSFYRAEQYEPASAAFEQVIENAGADVVEAAHWLARILLKQDAAAEVVKLIDRVLPQAGESEYLVHLKMDQADALYELDQWREEALTRYLAVAEQHADHPLASQALYNAAFGALELNRYADAARHASAFLKKYPQDRLLPDVKYVAAESALQLQDYARAESLFRDLATHHAQHVDHNRWQVRLGLTLYLEKKYADAVAQLQPVAEALSDEDLQAEAHYLIGVSHFYQQQYGEAEQALARSLESSRRWAQADEAMLYRSRAQREQEQLAAARKTVAELVDEFPESGLLDRALYRSGQYAYDDGDFDAAIAHYTKMLERFPQSEFAPYAWYGKGWALLKAKRYEPAAEAFAQLRAAYPEHDLTADAYLARAMSLRQAGQPAEAMQDLQRYLDTGPEGVALADALYERGLAQAALQQHAAAADSFQQLLQQLPDYAAADRARYELGWALKSDGKSELAAEQFVLLIKNHPQSPLVAEAHFHVGERQYEEQEFAEAAKHYRQAAQQAKEPALKEKSLYKLAWSAFQQEQFQPALAAFDQQVSSFPQGELVNDGLLMKAESLFRLEKYDEALEAYRGLQLAELSSPQLVALALLHAGQSASQQEQWDVAADYFDQILQQHVDSLYAPQAWYELGWVRQNQQQLDQALEAYGKATGTRGEVGARARFMMGEVFFEQKKFDEAIRQFQRVMYGFGAQQAPADVKVWQAKAGFEAGRCADVQIVNATDPQVRAKWIADATKYYGYVVENHPQSEMAEPAGKRLQELKAL